MTNDHYAGTTELDTVVVVLVDYPVVKKVVQEYVVSKAVELL